LLSKTCNIETNETKEIDLPKSNVLSYTLEGGNAVIVRPSGTEPKIKLYLTSVGTSKENTLEIMESLKTSAKKLLGVE
ncbi:MAG: phospho-sugar mutase, partial [Ruminococcus sp.]|nr:phospho-sugar mutase [Ruminococcus sp.]